MMYEVGRRKPKPTFLPVFDLPYRAFGDAVSLHSGEMDGSRAKCYGSDMIRTSLSPGSATEWLNQLNISPLPFLVCVDVCIFLVNVSVWMPLLSGILLTCCLPPLLS